MNPEDTQEVQKPDFEGAEMKMPENATPMPDETPSKVINGPLLIGLAVLLIAILAGLYYWFMVLSVPPANDTMSDPVTRPTAEENNEPESTTAEVQTESMQVLSTSDEIDAIEADLESTNLNELDAELDTIDAELEASASAQ